MTDGMRSRKGVAALGVLALVALMAAFGCRGDEPTAPSPTATTEMPTPAMLPPTPAQTPARSISFRAHRGRIDLVARDLKAML